MSSSTSIIDILKVVTQQINIYVGLFIFITGIVGSLLNIVVFTSLRTFRQTTCAFYLTTASIASIGQSLTVLLRFFNTSLNFYSWNTSVFCKFRYFLSQYCALVYLTNICMATIDQFLSMTKYRHLNNLRLARRHIACTSIFWFIHGIFTFIYYDSNQNVCVMTNDIFAKYYTYFYLPILLGILPLTITSIFSSIAFFKIRTIASRQINIVRLSRDRQLTKMTLVHALFIILTTIPFVSFFAYSLSVNVTNPEEIARNQLINTMVTLLAYEGYTCPFYIYCCASKRFRKQVAYVLFYIHLNRWRRKFNNLNNNQIVPDLSDRPSEQLDRPNTLNDIALY